MNRRNLLKSLFVTPFLSLFNWKDKEQITFKGIPIQENAYWDKTRIDFYWD